MLFLDNRSLKEKEEYYSLLKIIGSLSNLFSESKEPYLSYRATENIFCKAFSADNLSRSDCSADARKDNIGVGIKTFLNKNGNSLQKIAEFNKNREEYSRLEKKPEDFVRYLSELRNKRIEATKNIHDIEYIIYHCITRAENKLLVYEEEMDCVDISRINNISSKKSTISFTDNKNDYIFNISKSTLFKKFKTKENSKIIDIEIIKDPYEFLKNFFESQSFEYTEMNEENNFVILPLYSLRDKIVPVHSGLNQWNAHGRKRKTREVYIPVPTYIHKKFPDFFPLKDKKFNLILPNKKILIAKMCQESKINGIDRGKAIMSNPNTDLGDWMLDEVLKIPENKIVTLDLLKEIGLDSIEVRKINDENFELNFKKLGSYEEFLDKTQNNA